MGCEFNGRQLNVGDNFRVDVCSQCSCTSNGRIVCRRYICPIQCEGAVYRPQVCCPFCGEIRKNQKIVTTASIHFSNQTFYHNKNDSQYIHPSLSPDRQCVIQLNSAQMIWKENDRWYPDSCTVCDCRAGQVVCQSQTCERADCSPENRIIEKGKCCPVCRKISTTTLPTITTTELPDASSGQCKLSADGHLRTFDGKSLRLERQCANFIVTQQCLFESERPKFLLKMHNDREGQVRKLSIELNENNGIRLGILNFVKGKHLKYRGRRIKLPQHTRIFRAYQSANRTTLDLHFVGLKIIWTIEKSVRIFAERQHFDKLCGLCGNFNDHNEDDFLPQFGLKVAENSTEFVDSWRSDEDDECQQAAKDEIYEEEFDAETSTKHDDDRCSRLLSPANRLERRSYSKQCQKIKQNPLLQSCHSVLGIHSFLRRCAVEVCRCQSIESTSNVFKRSTKLKNKNPKRIQPIYLNSTTVPSIPCYCPVMKDYVQKCATGGLLTMGLSQQSNSKADGHLSFHPKCPPIKLELPKSETSS
ncbi:BMP-binding endothelial regulator protein [Aphelenchoides besseyi]|nr:BMP-binding endothelial regulator protein [Aphelenchoides besseyi]